MIRTYIYSSHRDRVSARAYKSLTTNRWVSRRTIQSLTGLPTSHFVQVENAADGRANWKMSREDRLQSEQEAGVSLVW